MAKKNKQQPKKSLYRIYPQLKSQVAKLMRKSGDRDFKKMNNDQLIAMTLESSPEMMRSLDFLIMSEEALWDRSGHHAIFPESAEVIDNLIRAKYEMASPEGFALPYESFIFAIPNGYVFDGVEIPSFLVSFMDYKTAPENTIIPFCNQLKLPAPEEVQRVPSGENARCICISYQDERMHNLAYGRSMQLDEILPQILSCQNATEFKQVCGEYIDTFGVMPSETYDLIIQFFAIKLVAALGVYTLATEGSRLIDGFPGSVAPRLLTKTPEQKIRYSTLTAPVPSDEEKVQGSFYRAWHFRQLRAERYYKGQHENTPRGSRYVFVSDTVVGTKVTAHTQT